MIEIRRDRRDVRCALFRVIEFQFVKKRIILFGFGCWRKFGHATVGLSQDKRFLLWLSRVADAPRVTICLLTCGTGPLRIPEKLLLFRVARNWAGFGF